MERETRKKIMNVVAVVVVVVPEVIVTTATQYTNVKLTTDKDDMTITMKDLHIFGIEYIPERIKEKGKYLPFDFDA